MIAFFVYKKLRKIKTNQFDKPFNKIITVIVLQ